jgi:hypothetical protein
MRIPSNFLLTVINDEINIFKNMFDVSVIGETESPSATSEL